MTEFQLGINLFNVPTVDIGNHLKAKTVSTNPKIIIRSHKFILHTKNVVAC